MAGLSPPFKRNRNTWMTWAMRNQRPLLRPTPEHTRHRLTSLPRLLCLTHSISHKLDAAKHKSSNACVYRVAILNFPAEYGLPEPEPATPEDGSERRLQEPPAHSNQPAAAAGTT